MSKSSENSFIHKAGGGAISEIGTLHYYPNKPNNLLGFSKSIATYVQTHYGILYTIFLPGQADYVAPPPPTKPTEAEMRADIFVKDDYKASRAIWLKQIATIDDHKIRVFGVIKGQLSAESIDAMTLHRADWAAAHGTGGPAPAPVDPLMLWKLVVKVHTLMSADTLDPVVAKADTKRMYDACQQHKGELLERFRERFMATHTQAKATGVLVPDDGVDLAMEFMNKLHPAYSDFVLAVKNGVIIGSREHFQTVDAVYTAASRFLVAAGSKADSTKLTETGKGSDAPKTSHQIHLTASGPKFDKGSRKPDKRGDTPKSAPKATSGDASAAPGHKKKEKGGESDKSKSDKKKLPGTLRGCRFCDGRHYDADCPAAKEAHTAASVNLHVCIPAYAGERHTSFYLQNAEPANDCAANQCAAVAACLAIGKREPPIAAASEHQQPSEVSLFSERIMSASKSGAISPYDILLDNQATTGVFNNANLLNNIVRARNPVTCVGIGGSLAINQEGTNRLVGTPVLYHPDAPANILSLGELEGSDSVRVTMVPRWRPPGTPWGSSEPEPEVHNAFIVHTTDGKVLVFKWRDNLYVHDATPGLEGTIMVSTVAGQSALYSKRDVAAAHQAHEASRKLGFPSPKDLQRASQVMDNVPFTAHDVTRAAAIYGEINSLKGKLTARAPTMIKEEQLVERVIHKGQFLRVDIMFVDGDPWLISLSHPCGYCLTTFLLGLSGGTKGMSGARSTSVVGAALKKHLSFHRAHDFTIEGIQCDGEGAVAANETAFGILGIPFNLTGAGRHVPDVEVKVRRVKERARAVRTTLPFTLCRMLMRFLVVFCTHRVNLFPSRTSSHGISPWEQVWRRRPNFKQLALHGFGDYCLTTKPDPEPRNSVTIVRGEDCIALYCTQNLQGTWVYLHLASGRIVRRDHATPAPMPDTIIAFLNNLAVADKKAVPPDLPFHLGSRPVADEDDVSAERAPRPAVINLDDPLPAIDSHSADDEGIPVGPPPAPAEAPAEAPAVPVLARVEAVEQGSVPVPDPIPAPALAPIAVEEPSAEAGRATDRGGESTPPPALPTSATATEATSSHGGEQSDEQPTHGGAHRRSSAVADAQPLPDAPLHTHNLRPRRPRSSPHDRWEERINFIQLHQFGFHITCKAALKRQPQAALKAIFSQMLAIEGKGTFTPVLLKNLSTKQLRKVISSSLFLKEKFTSQGAFDKLKARLVAGGHQQDKSLYDNLAAPTVALQSVFMVAVIAAKEKRHVRTLDIGSAYLNADKAGTEEVIMKLDPLIAAVLVYIKHDYEQFLLDDGAIYVKLNKALYGLVESALLWYEDVSGYLQANGFTPNPLDMCVFNEESPGGKQCSITLFVDDLMITCADMARIERVTQLLISKYGEVTTSDGTVHSYLGMTFNFSTAEKVRVTMEKFTADLLKDYEVTGKAATPAAHYLFDVREDAPRLTQEKSVAFHSCAARVLYLAKRVRPELLVALSFLVTRVQTPTVDDERKLARVLAYLNAEPNLGITLTANNGFNVVAHVDASYGVHPDAASHTGLSISLGDGPVFVKSTKQKLVSKSSTEAELIGLSDSASQVIWTRDFLTYQGYEMDPATVYQDNMSTIALANNGRSTSARTRHIHIRFFFIKDRMESGEIKIVHLPTSSMLADMLTKPLQGEAFRTMRNALLNCTA